MQVTLPRRGKSALRFRGRRLTGLRSTGHGAIAAEMALWARGDQRWAVSVSVEGTGRPVSDAAVVSGIDAACDWVETLVAEMLRAADSPTEAGAQTGTATDLLDYLEICCAEREVAALLAHLAGVALAEWPHRFGAEVAAEERV